MNLNLAASEAGLGFDWRKLLMDDEISLIQPPFKLARPPVRGHHPYPGRKLYLGGVLIEI